MTPAKKLLLGSLALLGAFGLGLSMRQEPDVQIKVEEKIVYRERNISNDEIIQNNDKTTVVEKRPDGTTITSMTDQGRSRTISRRWAEIDTTMDKKFSKRVSSSPQFSVGVSAHKDLAELLSPVPRYEFEFGRRIVGNAWITGSFDVQKKGAGVGVRMEF